MTYSYTQLSAFLACPRRYRYRYLEGWQEKETRASLLFGRAFEQALAAYFLGLDYQARWREEWSSVRDLEITYTGSESWEEMLSQGQELLETFASQDRVQVARPRQDLQIKCCKRLAARNDFLGFIDAIGTLDGTRSVIDWKTSGSCYTAQPTGVVALDPQLTLKQEVERALNGPGAEPWDLIYFKLYKSQIPVIEQALETAARLLGSDKSRGYCLEMICADFVAGANLEGGNPEVLLFALQRFFHYLPPGQQHRFLLQLKVDAQAA